MKKALLVSCLLVVVLLQGCTTPRARIGGLTLGMSTDEVRQIMGDPFTIRAAKVYEGGNVTEVWEYVPPIFSMAAISDNYDKNYWIYITDGKVVQWGEPGDFSGVTTLSGAVPVTDVQIKKEGGL